MSRRALLGSVLPCACVAALAACGGFVSSFRPTVGEPRGTGPTNDAFGTGRADAGGLLAGRDSTFFGRPRDRVRAASGESGALAQRRQCRTGAIASGWIAVAYEASAGQCPGRSVGGADSAATVAVLVRYATAPVGTRLDVCADQPIPGGWNEVTDEGPGDLSACPQAAPPGKPTAVRIRRSY